MGISKLFWLLHAFGAIPVKDSDGGDLKWLGAIVENVDRPEQGVDWRPPGLTLIENQDWESVPINDAKVYLEMVRKWSLKVKLAKCIGVDIDNNGRVVNDVYKKKIVAYRMYNDQKTLEKMLNTDNHRATIIRQLSSVLKNRWLVVGFLVAIPGDSLKVTGAVKTSQDEPDPAGADENDAENEPDTDAGESPAPGTEQAGVDGSGIGGFGDPLTGAAAATGAIIPGMTLEIDAKLDISKVHRVKGESPVPHIFAIEYRALKKEALGSGIKLRNGPHGDNAFSSGTTQDQTEQQLQEVKETVFLSGTSLKDELEAELLSAGDDDGKEDIEYKTESVESSMFANPEDAARFERLFGGGLEFVYEDTCAEE